MLVRPEPSPPRWSPHLNPSVTYLNECLLTCSGTTLAYRGGCTTPWPDPTMNKGGVALGDNGLGQFVYGGSLPSKSLVMPAGGASATRGAATIRRGADSVTMADIDRFKAEGMVLIGPSRVLVDAGTTDKPTKPTGPRQGWQRARVRVASRFIRFG